MTVSGGQSIDLGRLLTIDVRSELKKLSQAQLQGPWQIPSELVRRAIRLDSKRVDVVLGRHRIAVRDDGRGISFQEIQETAVLLDSSQGDERRHAALTTLEKVGAIDLLAVAGLDPSEFEIECVRDGVQTTLQYTKGQVPHVARRRGLVGQGTEIRIRSPAFDRRQVSDWLTHVTRFATAQVTVDGTRVAQGFGDALGTAQLRAPLVGTVAIPSSGETGHVWLVAHGVISGHLTVPGSFCFEAAVELSNQSEEIASPARLREAMTPLIPTLVKQAASLLARLAREQAASTESSRSRLAGLILDCIRRGHATESLLEARVFRIVNAHGLHLASLSQLRTNAWDMPGGTQAFYALYPSQRIRKFALGTSSILIADAGERSRIAEVIGIRFRPPNRRDASSWWANTTRRMAGPAKRIFTRAIARLRSPWRPSPLPEADLTPDELDLVKNIRRQLKGTIPVVELCEGAGPIHRTFAPVAMLMLPRENPTVQAAIAAMRANPAWLYPVALAFLDGDQLPPPSVRSTWLTRGPA